MKITDITYDALDVFWKSLEPEMKTMATLEAATQRFATGLYDTFRESIVLARVFVTLDLRQLPERERAFVSTFSENAGIESQLDPSTTVLTLLGTDGVEDAWKDRFKSAGHLATPLVSEQFVREIPMVSRLLQEIGFRPEWDAPSKNLFVTKALVSVNGIFFVPDAENTRDELDRKIIPASDFVKRYGVRAVFGFGGSYLSQAMFIAAIIFCRESVSRSDAMKFVPLISSLKAVTTGLVKRSRFFTPA